MDPVHFTIDIFPFFNINSAVVSRMQKQDKSSIYLINISYYIYKISFKVLEWLKQNNTWKAGCPLLGKSSSSELSLFRCNELSPQLDGTRRILAVHVFSDLHSSLSALETASAMT